MEKLSVLAPAKINLYLNVCARRADGYHDIESVMQTVTLFDRIEVTKYPFSGKNEIALFCSETKLPADETNLIYRAAVAFFGAAGILEYHVAFSLEKKIPLCRRPLAPAPPPFLARLFGEEHSFSLRPIRSLLCFPCSSFAGTRPVRWEFQDRSQIIFENFFFFLR